MCRELESCRPMLSLYAYDLSQDVGLVCRCVSSSLGFEVSISDLFIIAAHSPAD